MIVTFGSLNADMIFDMQQAPDAGQTVLADSFRIEAGGKGANQAVAAARAGSLVVMVGAVGADALAQTALANLRGADVDVTRVSEVDIPTGCASIIVEANEQNRISVALGANTVAKASQVNDALLANTDVLLMQMEGNPVEIEALIRRADACEVFTILNLAPAARIAESALELCDLVVVNEDEAEFTAAWLGCEATALGLSAALRTAVVRTLGSQGAEVAVNDTQTRIPAPAVTPVDTTAAGDCFIGVLAAALQSGMALEAATARAVGAASLCCTRKGSQQSLPWISEIDDFFAKAA